jgi:hypothetical protein
MQVSIVNAGAMPLLQVSLTMEQRENDTVIESQER